MSDFFSDISGWFLSPTGVLVLAALDASMVFFSPAAIDMAVVFLSARSDNAYLLIPLLATAGSTLGAAVTYGIGRKGGDSGLKRWVSPARLKRVRDRLGERGFMALATAALLPPPFPLTPFVLTGGALGMNATKLLAVLAGARLVHFGAEALVARVYGERVLAVMQSGPFRTIVAGLIALAVAGTIVTIVLAVRRTERV